MIALFLPAACAGAAAPKGPEGCAKPHDYRLLRAADGMPPTQNEPGAPCGNLEKVRRLLHESALCSDHRCEEWSWRGDGKAIGDMPGFGQ